MPSEEQTEARSQALAEMRVRHAQEDMALNFRRQAEAEYDEFMRKAEEEAAKSDEQKEQERQERERQGQLNDYNTAVNRLDEEAAAKEAEKAWVQSELDAARAELAALQPENLNVPEKSVPEVQELVQNEDVAAANADVQAVQNTQTRPTGSLMDIANSVDGMSELINQQRYIDQNRQNEAARQNEQRRYDEFLGNQNDFLRGMSTAQNTQTAAANAANVNMPVNEGVQKEPEPAGSLKATAESAINTPVGTGTVPKTDNTPDRGEYTYQGKKVIYNLIPSGLLQSKIEVTFSGEHDPILLYDRKTDHIIEFYNGKYLPEEYKKLTKEEREAFKQDFSRRYRALTNGQFLSKNANKPGSLKTAANTAEDTQKAAMAIMRGEQDKREAETGTADKKYGLPDGYTIEGSEDSRTLKGAKKHQFVLRNGKQDWGYVTEDLAKGRADIPVGAIRVQVGDRNFGLKHAKTKHLKDALKNYATAEDFIAHIIDDGNEIIPLERDEKGRPSEFLVARSDKRRKQDAIIITWDEKGSYYTLKTAYAPTEEYLERQKLPLSGSNSPTSTPASTPILSTATAGSSPESNGGRQHYGSDNFNNTISQASEGVKAAANNPENPENDVMLGMAIAKDEQDRKAKAKIDEQPEGSFNYNGSNIEYFASSDGTNRYVILSDGKRVGIFNPAVNKITYGDITSDWSNQEKSKFSKTFKDYYDKTSGASSEGYGSSGATLDRPMRTRPEEGAEVLNSRSDVSDKEQGFSNTTLSETTPPVTEREQNTGSETILKQENNEVNETQSEQSANVTASMKVAEQIKHWALKNYALEPMTKEKLLKMCEDAFGGTLAEGKFTMKDAYDALEMGVNQAIKTSGVRFAAPQSDTDITRHLGILSALVKNLPTQTAKMRTEEQNEFQQFSTPPHIAYIANWLANIGANDVVLEPSAGVGGLAVFAKTAGAEVVMNELSPRRAALLEAMGLGKVYRENAEHINDILPDTVKPTRIVMNPPFSATAGRVEGQRRTSNAYAHVEQALARLEDGGRLVAILGKGMNEDAPAHRDWWRKIKSEYNVRANVLLDGQEYKKYGTTFGNVIVVIDKNGATPENGTVTGSFEKVSDMIMPLMDVRNSAAQTQTKADQSVEVKNGSKTSETAKSESVETERTLEEQYKTLKEQHPDEILAFKNGDVYEFLFDDAEKAAKELDIGLTRRNNTPVASIPQHGLDVYAGRLIKNGHKVAICEQTNGANIKVTPFKQTEQGIKKPETTAAAETQSDTQPEKSVAAIKTENKTEAERQAERKSDNSRDENYVFDDYKPSRLKIEGSKHHPADLVESAAMASISMPEITYSPHLDEKIIKEGLLSDAQLEAVVYAGQAFNVMNKDGTRRGFFIGDGTGLGKGREIAGIITDQMNQGHGNGKAVWVSMNIGLMKDAQRDYSGIGNNPDDIFAQAKTKKGDKIKDRKGIIFTQYSQIRNEDRLNQLKEWLGADFDGVIALDEVHNANNASDSKGERGTKKASQQALAVLDFVKAFSKARVLYVSATGATEVRNLAMLERLGLWGEGTQFSNQQEFVNSIEAGGKAAMEVVARDLKAMGLYVSRSISQRSGAYGGNEDVTFARLSHNLTDEQTAIYNKIAEAWRYVYQNIQEAIKACGATRGGGKSMGAAASAFYNLQQKCFNQIITAMQTPAVIQDIKKQLAAGNSVLIQLTNTEEAALNRAIAGLSEDETLEDLDVTPKDNLIQFLKNSFPVQKLEEYEDENHNIQVRKVVDSEGNPVLSKEAVAMRDRLIAEVNSIRFPESPIDMIINAFGAENVAEVTGRTQRVVRDSSGKLVREKRSLASRENDKTAFNEGRKRILIFSEAGGTGASYHASRDFKNQQKRVHYLLQAGWRADVAVQGLGRSHRSNEAHKPHYVLVETDIPGQKRFLSTIARRLEQLGALTTGERKAASNGLFSERDNLESVYAKDALESLCRYMKYEHPDYLKAMGYNVKSGTDFKTPPITQFLNRILLLDTDVQKEVFEEFAQRIDEKVAEAIQNGTLDVGMETVRADKISVKQEQSVYKDNSNGIETKYVELEVLRKQKPLDIGLLQKQGYITFYKNRDGKVIAARRTGGQETDYQTGAIKTKYELRSPDPYYHSTSSALDNKDYYTKLGYDEAAQLWAEQSAALPEYHTEKQHMITGALLPIWNSLKGSPRIRRVVTEDGRTILGRIIPPAELNRTLKNLGAQYNGEKFTPQNVFKKLGKLGASAHLSNGWELKTVRVYGENRIEIRNLNFYNVKEFEKAGAIVDDSFGYQRRVFIPTGNEAIMQKVLDTANIVEFSDEISSDIEEAINENIPDEEVRKNEYFNQPVVTDGEIYEQRTARNINKDRMTETYGNDKALNSISTSKNVYLRSVALGLDEAAEKVGELNGDLSIKDDILAAVNALDRINEAGLSVNASMQYMMNDTISQLPELKDVKFSKEALRLLGIFDKYKGSGAKIAAALNKYSELAMDANNQGKSKTELLRQAVRYLDAADGYQLDLEAQRLETRLTKMLTTMNHSKVDAETAAIYAKLITNNYKYFARATGKSIDELIKARDIEFIADGIEKRGRGRPRKNAGEDSPTNVNTKQWVETPRAAKSVTEAAELVRSSGILNTELKNEHLGITATISNGGLRKMESQKATEKSVSPRLHALAVANVDSLFKSASMDFTHPDSHGRTEVKQVRRLGTAMFDPETGKYVPVMLTAIEYIDALKLGRKLYSVEAVDVVGYTKNPAGQSVGVATQSNSPTPITGFVKRIANFAKSVNDIYNQDKTGSRRGFVEFVNGNITVIKNIYNTI